MADEEEGTTEFRAGGLKDLLDSQESPAKPGGGGGDRRPVIVGGAVAAVVALVLIAVVLAGGGGGDDDEGAETDGNGGVPIGIEMRPSAAVGITPGRKISVCDSEAGPVAEGVVLRDVTPAKSAAGQDIVQLVVLAEGGEINALGPTKAKSTWRAIGSESCPALESTSTSEPPTTLPPVEPPSSTPPDSVPTPPPSG